MLVASAYEIRKRAGVIRRISAVHAAPNPLSVTCSLETSVISATHRASRSLKGAMISPFARRSRGRPLRRRLSWESLQDGRPLRADDRGNQPINKGIASKFTAHNGVAPRDEVRVKRCDPAPFFLVFVLKPGGESGGRLNFWPADDPPLG